MVYQNSKLVSADAALDTVGRVARPCPPASPQSKSLAQQERGSDEKRGRLRLKCVVLRQKATARYDLATFFAPSTWLFTLSDDPIKLHFPIKQVAALSLRPPNLGGLAQHLNLVRATTRSVISDVLSHGHEYGL